MVHAIRLKAYGEPEVLAWDQVEVGKPATGQVRIRQTANPKPCNERNIGKLLIARCRARPHANRKA
jgi:hypothetical protein